MAAPAILQKSAVTYGSTNATVTLPSITAGSTLVGFTFQYGSAARNYTWSDDSGNRWHEGAKNAGGSRVTQIDVAYNVAGSASTVTFTHTASASASRYFVVYELEPCRLVAVQKFDNTDGDNTHYCAPSGEINTFQPDIRLFAVTGCTAESGCSTTGSWVEEDTLYSTQGGKVLTLASSSPFSGERCQWTGSNNRYSYNVLAAFSSESNALTKAIRLPDGQHASGGARPTLYYGPARALYAASTTRNLNNATYKLMTSFVAPVSEAIATLWVYLATYTGTVTNIGKVELQAADENGLPTGSVLESSTFTPSGTAPTYVEITTGWTTVLTAGSMYCLSLTNTDAAPATNYYSSGHAADSVGSLTSIGSSADGGLMACRWYNGSWSGASTPSSAMVLRMANGSYVGWPGFASTNGYNTASDIYGTRGYVVSLTMPGHAAVEYRITGVRVVLDNVGSPAGPMDIRVYPYTARPIIASGNLPAGGGIPCMKGSAWSSGLTTAGATELDLVVPVWVRGGSIVNIELMSPLSQTAANCYNVGRTWGISTSLIPANVQLAMAGVKNVTAAYYPSLGSPTDDGASSDPPRYPTMAVLIDNMRTARTRSRQTWR